MSRPRKRGLDYFPFDVVFFSDKKIRILKSRFGADGIMIYIYLLCEIYKNGYYIQLDDDYEYIIADDLKMSSEKVKQVLKFLLERSLLDSKLFQSDTIITSQGIQRRFQEAVKSRASKSTLEVDARYWILNESETQPFIKVSQNPSYSEKNLSYSLKNPSYSEKNDTKKSKEKKSKEKENNCASAFPSFNAEKAWCDTFAVYPKKSSAVIAKQVWMDKLLPVLEANRKAVAELIYLATRMYLDDYTDQNPEDVKFRYIPKYSDWLTNDCDYWIDEYEKTKRGNDR